jgi:hypothetical protein
MEVAGGAAAAGSLASDPEQAAAMATLVAPDT